MKRDDIVQGQDYFISRASNWKDTGVGRRCRVLWLYALPSPSKFPNHLPKVVPGTQGALKVMTSAVLLPEDDPRARRTGTGLLVADVEPNGDVKTSGGFVPYAEYANLASVRGVWEDVSAQIEESREKARVLRDETWRGELSAWGHLRSLATRTGFTIGSAASQQAIISVSELTKLLEWWEQKDYMEETLP